MGKQHRNQSSDLGYQIISNLGDFFEVSPYDRRERPNLFEWWANQHKGYKPIETPSTPVDLIETDERYEILVNVVGIDKENIAIKAGDKEIFITVEPKETVDVGKIYHIRERTKTAISRKIGLRKRIYVDSVEASVKDGVLTITADKKDSAEFLEIKID